MKKIKSLIWETDKQIKLTVGQNGITNIVRRGVYPQAVEYYIYEQDKQRPRVIDGLRVDKVEYFE